MTTDKNLALELLLGMCEYIGDDQTDADDIEEITEMMDALLGPGDGPSYSIADLKTLSSTADSLCENGYHGLGDQLRKVHAFIQMT